MGGDRQQTGPAARAVHLPLRASVRMETGALKRHNQELCSSAAPGIPEASLLGWRQPQSQAAPAGGPREAGRTVSSFETGT